MSIIKNFASPDMDSRGMFRCWFPDAGADLDRIENHVRTVYQAGFGGMEIAMVPQYADFDQKEYGWGTPRWKEMLRRILQTAVSCPEPMKIDLTITAHWPPALNTIDPNHPAAQKELRYTVTKVRQGGVMELPMPETRICDDDAEDAAHFIFVDEFLCAVKGTIVGRKGKKYILGHDSLQDVSSCVKVLKKTTPAGIAYDETKFGNKQKLKDTQHYYAIDLDAAGIAPAEGDRWEIGDTLLFAYFTRGTGQTLSGRGMPMFHLHLPMADKMYATDYYCTEGTDAIIDFWEKNILDDQEIRDLLGKIDGAIFEDSIELSCATIPWTNRFAENFKALRGYDILPFLPVLQSLKGSPWLFLTDKRVEKLLVDDYYTTLNDLYIRDHVGRLTDWTHTFGYKYRAQSYGGDVNTAAASCVLDVAEGESLGFGEMREYFRNLSGGVHMTGRKFLSDEVLADLMAGYCLDWKSAAGTLNSNWSAGVNRMVIHGMSYETEVSGKNSQWPGWHAFMNAFADPWGDRQPYWHQVKKLSGYIARTQAVLQGGSPKLDIAVYKAQRAYGWGYTKLLDYGYSYDVISNPHLFLPEATVESGVLCPNGPQYQAILVVDQEMIPETSAVKLLEMAKQGLSVLFVGDLPKLSTGAFTENQTVVDVVEEMKSLAAVAVVPDLEAAVQELRKRGIQARAAYDCPKVESICRQDESGTYYFFYNGGEETSVQVTLTGSGNPVLVDAWSGKIIPVPFVKKENGTQVEISLHHRDSAIVALLPEAAQVVEKKLGEAIPLENFDTTIISWGPDPDAAIPTQSKKTTLELGVRKACVWDELEVTQAQLDALGVDGMNHVSGQGFYKTEFQLPACDGAVLTVDTGACMVVSGKLNGREIPALNQRSGKVDLEGLTQEGTNTLELEIATTLINRLRIAHPLFDGKGGMPAPPSAPEGAEAGASPVEMMEEENDYELPGAPMDMPEPRGDQYHYGILGASVTPYYNV